MRILILHHVEPMWEACFNRYELLQNIITHINRAKYDKVILSTLEGDRGYEELEPYIDQTVDWSYAWGRTPEEAAEDFGLPIHDVIEVSSPHETAYLYDWIKDLKGHTVSVCGGHHAECLLDLEESLQHLGIKYRRITKCIY